MEFIKMLLDSSVVWQLLALATLLIWALVIEWVVLHLLNQYEWRIKRKLRRFPWYRRRFLVKCLRKIDSIAFGMECRANRLVFWGKICITFPKMLCKLLSKFAEFVRKVRIALCRRIRSLETGDC